MHEIRSALSAFLMFAFVPTSPAFAADKPLTETQKIEALVKHIAELKDAVFVRNGKEYDAKTAAKFIKGKWDANKDEIKTAEDFIEKAASFSSTSGKPYLIRFKDGSEKRAATICEPS